MSEDLRMNADLPNRVLYLEDNPVDADLLHRALARQAPQIALDVVSSLSEAMQRVAPATPDYELILSDLRLPDGNGMELLAHVRERRLPVAVVILTGSGDQASAIAALKAGADDYVVKRADYHNRLIHTLAAALARFRSEFARKARVLRVLYAEHNDFDIDLMRRHFARHAPQIRLHIVNSGHAVLDALPQAADDSLPYDVVLLDYQLPGINALEIAKILRDERGLDLPVVLATGQGSEDVVAEALRLGVADYVVKHAGYLTELPAVLEHAHRQAQLMREQTKLRTTAERLRQLLAANPTILYTLHVDGTRMTPQWLSENITRVYGYSVEECLQPGWWWAGLHADDRERVQVERQRLFVEDSLTHEYRFHDKTGAIRWVRDDMRLLYDGGGKPVAVAGSWSDITERKRADEQQHWLATIVESSSDAVIGNTLDGTILSWNQAAERMLGYSASEVIGRSICMLLPQDCAMLVSQSLERVGRGEFIEQYETEWQCKDGMLLSLSLTISPIRGAGGVVRGMSTIARDITERKRAEEQIRYLAQHDALTGLPNRNLCCDRISQSIAQARRDQRKVAVLFLDLDHFKMINDSLGHQVGDNLLQVAAQRLQRCVRAGDSVSRIGGDEFVISLPMLGNATDATAVAEKVLHAIREPYPIGHHDLHVSCSIGISLYPTDGEDANVLMRAADAAMYHAKSNGRNNYQLFTAELNVATSRRLAIANGLHEALERRQFTLEYQPQIDFASGRIVAVEALVRWRAPELGQVPPSEFIRIAEETGSIAPLGEWVLREACLQVMRWQEGIAPDLRLAVNVSPHQFRGLGFADLVLSILRESRLTASDLEIEITEGTLMAYGSQNSAVLERLADKGVCLAVDDFGTGYSSLAYLRRFPIRCLKIDRSFIDGVGYDSNDAAIVAAVIAMARSMQLRVVAEGVETAEQVAFLKRHRCWGAQGFHYGKPMSADAFVEILAKREKALP
jgi:diguanylate cyclase (GGDEF)-like protein/PAS domain S-box-containing protein